MVKRLSAFAAGSVMLGATVSGALAAADLNTYPNMFVTDGTFNGFFVVGEKAASVDNLAMTDIAASMMYKKPSDKKTTTVTGDAWKVGTSSKKLEMANSNITDTSINGEQFRDIVTFIGDEELQALADGGWATNERTYDFQQFLFWDEEGYGGASRSRIVKYAESDDNIDADYFFLGNGRQIGRYKMEFSSTAQSDVTDSAGSSDTTGTYLDDFENTNLDIMGKPYTVVLARRPLTSTTATGGEMGIKLILMAGSARDTLLEGEKKTYSVKDKTYEVQLSFVDDDEAKFIVNGESTNKLKVGETYVLKDKSEIGVSEVLYQSYAGGVHSTTFFVGASKMEIRDDQVTDVTGSYNVKMGSENIDGTKVIITGTDNNSTFTVSTIEVNMTAEDDFFVGAGKKLSDVIAAASEEKEVLFGQNWDVEYKGLSDETTHDLKVKTSSSRRYQLHLFDGDGKAIDVPIAYAEGNLNLSIGEEAWTGSRANNKRLILTESASGGTATDGGTGDNIYKDDYFVVTGGTATDGSAKSYLMQYKGSDKQTKSSPKIKFKNLGNGETLEYSVSSVSTSGTGTVATIKLGGYSFFVENASSTLADDFQLHVDLDGGATLGTNTVTIVDSYGARWTLDRANVTANEPGLSATNTTAQESIQFSLDAPNGDDYDNVAPAVVRVNITSTSDPEVRAAVSGLTLRTPDGKTDVSYGYTSMGSFITLNSPTSDPQELTLAYPEKQRTAQVYVTSGAVTSATSAAGDLTAVTVVDATKLDTEVADATAQNLIVVGGPCVNSVAAELLGNPSDCTEGFAPGKARVKLFEQTNGNVAMLVAGYSGADTRLAGKVVAHRASELSGTEVEVEGTTYSDATIGAPTPVMKKEEAAATTETATTTTTTS